MSLADDRAKAAQLAAAVTAEERRLASLTPAQRLAELLHDKLCTLNHTDYCGWYYGSWKSPLDHARRQYLARAEQVLTAVKGDETVATNVINAL